MLKIVLVKIMFLVDLKLMTSHEAKGHGFDYRGSNVTWPPYDPRLRYVILSFDPQSLYDFKESQALSGNITSCYEWD